MEAYFKPVVMEVKPYLKPTTFTGAQFPDHLSETNYANNRILDSSGGFAQYLRSTEVFKISEQF